MKMKSVRMMFLEFALSIAMPMIAGGLLARAVGSGFLQSGLIAGMMLFSGYFGGAVYLLRNQAKIWRWTRTRLAISLLAPAAVGVAALAQPLTDAAVGGLLFFGAIAPMPLLWAGARDVARGLRGIPPSTFSPDDLIDNVGIALSMAWGLFIATPALYLCADFLRLEWSAIAAAGILLINGAIEVGVLAWLIAILFLGGAEEALDTLCNGHAHGYTSNTDDDLLDWETSGDLDDTDTRNDYPEMKIFNPSTGYEMLGGFDTGGYALGEDPNHSNSFDSFSLHDTVHDSMSWHD